MVENTLCFVELSDSGFAGYEEFLGLVSPERREQILRFKFDIDKKLCLFSDLLVRYFVCDKLKLNNDELNFSKNSFGKPFLVGYPDFLYNVSHTKSAVLVGVSDKPVGVDVEKVRESELKIAKRFFCKNELEYILSCVERDKAFYEIWTKKEAYIKGVGKGMSLPLTEFDVTDPELDDMMMCFEVGGYMLAVFCEDVFGESDLEVFDEEQAVERVISAISPV